MVAILHSTASLHAGKLVSPIAQATFKCMDIAFKFHELHGLGHVLICKFMSKVMK